jgi:hypothetical protein
MRYARIQGPEHDQNIKKTKKVQTVFNAGFGWRLNSRKGGSGRFWWRAQLADSGSRMGGN